MEDYQCTLWKIEKYAFVISSDSEKSHVTESIFLAVLMAETTYSAI
jgi:hypothetical protein